MVWRFKDQTMSFDLGDDFVFHKNLAKALIENKYPIRPLLKHFLLWGRFVFPGAEGIGIDRLSALNVNDALKVPAFNVLDFDFDEQAEGEAPFMKQVASTAQEIRPLVDQSTSEPSAADATSSILKSTKGVDSDSEVRSLDEALTYPPGSLKSKNVAPDVGLKGLVRKRKSEVPPIQTSDSLPIEHLSGGKSSREEAAWARSAPTPTFSGGFLPINEVESMEVENPVTTGKKDGTTQSKPKMVTFSVTNLDLTLGLDFFIDDEEDQVSSLPPSWFGSELISFFRYADVFADDMEIDPATADEKFVPKWDIRNKDSVMDDLVSQMFLFNIRTPLDHARSRKMKIKILARRENLEKETLSLKRKIQRTPDAEKRLSLLSQDLQAQKKKVKTLTTQNQSSQATAASASEEQDKISAELRSFAEPSKKKDEEHMEVLARMEKSISNARAAYEKMMAECDALKTGEGDLKARMDEMKSHHKAEIEELKLEGADLAKKVEDLQATKAWLLSEGAQLLAKNIHKGPEMIVVVAAVNKAMSAIGVNSGLQNGYVHALKKKTPYAEVPELNRNAEAELNTTITCFDSLTFPVVNDLPKLVNAPLSKIKDALLFAGGESLKE
ncbi:hypothetical protein Hanom_Chr04g00336451 [Helianthus anomalus]